MKQARWAVPKRVNPIPENVEVYNKKYALYTKTVEALDCVWDAYQAFRDKD